jgi:hypothetical protein
MSYLIIAKADENNHPTHINQTEIESEANAVVAQLHSNGDTNAFAIETPHAFKDLRYMTVDFAAKAVTYDQAGSDNAVKKELAQAEIHRLEGQITNRRLREAYADATWMNAQEALIATERAKL